MRFGLSLSIHPRIIRSLADAPDMLGVVYALADEIPPASNKGVRILHLGPPGSCVFLKHAPRLMVVDKQDSVHYENASLLI